MTSDDKSEDSSGDYNDDEFEVNEPCYLSDCVVTLYPH